MHDEVRILAPTAILGYGYPAESLDEGMRRSPHLVAVDAGSTDGGPSYLGLQIGSADGGSDGQAAAFLEFVRRDLEPLLEAACEADIPLMIGSAGIAGGDIHLLGTRMVVEQIATERGLHFPMATIRAEIDRDYLKARIRQGAVRPLGPVPPLSEQDVDEAVRIVGQMGTEPFGEAASLGAQVVIAGRANDQSMFAAMPIQRGFDRGLALHLGKILECGAIAADPGSGSDGMFGTLRRDHFELEPLSPDRSCTVKSVAAHSLYEKGDPTRLDGPGGHVVLDDVRFEQVDDRRVRVSGSRFVPDPYCIKVEGVRRVGYRTVAICGVRDPAGVEHVEDLVAAATAEVEAEAAEVGARVLFHVYGRDGVMGDLETARPNRPMELCVLIEVVADEPARATSICGHARSTMLHHGFAGRISTAGNLAFPFSPLDVPVGAAYEFSIYHLVDEPDPLRLFPIERIDL